MLAAQRRREILRALAARGSVLLADLCAQFAISPATARRDAEHLLHAGLARRTHGGLLPPTFTLSEAGYSRKAQAAAGIKARLGQATAALLPEDGTIFIDAGSTCLEVARAVLDRPGLRIFTNSIPLLALAPESRATLHAIGGEVRGVSLALTGGLAQTWLEKLRFDVAVVGASGLDPADGASTTELAEAGVKSEALRRARLRILVAHGEKWGRPAAVHFSPWSAFHHFVTHHAPSRTDRAALTAAGVKLHPLSAR